MYSEYGARKKSRKLGSGSFKNEKINFLEN
jgi:hypothetical protein